MIKYYPKLSISMSEINYEPTLLLFSLEGCTFHCYKCLNYKTLIETKYDKYKIIDDICDYLKHNDYLFESIVLSGGEYLVSPLDTLMSDLVKIRNITKKKIIIYTNGMFPDKMIALKDIVDGFHVDMKLPYHLLDAEQDKELINITFGKDLSQSVINKLMKSIELTVSLDKGNNQIRSVRYPFLNDTAFEANKKYIEQLNNEFCKNTLYQVNNFIEEWV